ncbi:MAG TPA: DUF2064 domain-containing protein [Jatrophihabitantaceae bacterium]|jgi:hypothetical protein
MIGTLIVIAKAPVPGRVKTRLVPPLTYSQAADMARAALVDTVRVASRVPAGAHVIALDGRPGPWLPSGWRVVAQPGGDLDARLAAAFASARPDAPALLIGMDTPQIQADQLTAFDPARYDAAFGPAADGGFWTLALREPARAAHVIPGVPMSMPNTGELQLSRLRAAGLDVQLLDELTDVDTIAAADEVARLAPASEFARTLAGLRVPA